MFGKFLLHTMNAMHCLGCMRDKCISFIGIFPLVFMLALSIAPINRSDAQTLATGQSDNPFVGIWTASSADGSVSGTMTINNDLTWSVYTSSQATSTQSSMSCSVTGTYVTDSASATSTVTTSVATNGATNCPSVGTTSTVLFSAFSGSGVGSTVYFYFSDTSMTWTKTQSLSVNTQASSENPFIGIWTGSSSDGYLSGTMTINNDLTFSVYIAVPIAGMQCSVTGTYVASTTSVTWTVTTSAATSSSMNCPAVGTHSTVPFSAFSGIGLGSTIYISDTMMIWTKTQSFSTTPQTLSPITFSPATVSVGGTTTVSATASSGLGVSFTSATPSICSVSDNTVTVVATGTCTIAADQAGDASYSAAPQLTQSIVSAPVVFAVSLSGTGSGTVKSSDGNINCGSTCSAAYNSIVNLTLTPVPASGSTFGGWGGACTGTGACTVSLDAAKSVTATFSPIPFVAVTTGVSEGIITAPIATVTATVSFNVADKGKPQSVFVTAWVPSGTLSAAQKNRTASYTTRMQALGTTSASTFVLVQLTSSGWQPVINGELIPYVSGVLGDQSAAISILDNTSTSSLLGAQFCVGYGTSATDMTASGKMQLIASVPNPSATNSNTGSCNVALPISDDRVFAFAVSNYASFFAGDATSGQIDDQGSSYNYRYYPTYQNFLAVDNSGVVFIFGPISENIVTAVGPVEAFRSIITTWEGSQ